ncbi:unnamed protein product [Linum trigynum]|uniref:Epidermal patterning factor-like protein n=2 Tax=Linum trigynum TaxID=586398 RepID=A0AAV2FDC5_9ROSI
MGSDQFCFCCHRKKHLIFSLLVLLISSVILVRFQTEGRAISKLLEVNGVGEEEGKFMVRSKTIGSRPPKCDNRCGSCGGHCEAVQVPVTTMQGRRQGRSSRFSVAYTSRGEDYSNYKPMSWKCKCGNSIFNP